MASMGRPSIFIPKDGGKKIQILALTKTGTRLFEAARKRLAKLAQWPGKVSDADCVEFLVRGDAETSRHLAKRQKPQTTNAPRL